jgi:succinate-semialdehyde dehydrogenase/glutarate-semialdehyde dehydrogenase
VFVVGDAYEPFVTHIARVVDSLRIGSGADDATDVGPMIRPEQRELLASQVDEAMRGGARVVASLANDGAGGAFYSPMVIADVTPEMRVMREETFGPLLPIVRARDADDAIRLANASPYGLSASVWGRDLRRATDVARRIEAGSVSVNDVISQVGMAEAPHGGVKQSGNGRSHGQAGLLECVRTKTLIIDRLASRRQPWWFGYGAEHARGLDAFVRVWHAPSMRARVGAMWGAVKLLVRPERPL